MALTKNGNYIGRAAQTDAADWINEQRNRALNPSESELETMGNEAVEAKEEAANEAICSVFAPEEYGQLRREIYHRKKEYRSAIRRLVEKLEHEQKRNDQESVPAIQKGFDQRHDMGLRP